LVKGVTSSPMNLPLWVKLSKYPIDQNVVKVANKFMILGAGVQCVELNAPNDQRSAPTASLSGSKTWRCTRRSATLQIGKFY